VVSRCFILSRAEDSLYEHPRESTAIPSTLDISLEGREKKGLLIYFVARFSPLCPSPPDFVSVSEDLLRMGTFYTQEIIDSLFSPEPSVPCKVATATVSILM